MFSGAALIMSVAWALSQPAGPLGAQQAAVRLHAACVRASHEDREDIHIDSQLSDLRESLEELAGPKHAEKRTGTPRYDTFRQEGVRARFDLAQGSQAQQTISNRYRLQVTLCESEGSANLRFEIAVIEFVEPQHRNAWEREALRTTIVTKPGQKVRLGGLRTPQGDLVVILWGERLEESEEPHRQKFEDPAARAHTSPQPQSPAEEAN